MVGEDKEEADDKRWSDHRIICPGDQEWLCIGEESARDDALGPHANI